MTPEFKVGMAVRDEAGTQTMTITKLEDHEGKPGAECKWIVGDELKTGRFKLEGLVPVSGGFAAIMRRRRR